MKAIGRVLACVLLAIAFVKNVLATNTANIKFSNEQSNETVRSNVTRLELVSKSSLNSDIEEPWSIQDDAFKSEENHGKIEFYLHIFVNEKYANYKQQFMMTVTGECDFNTN
jgi:hypothetical protein